MKPRPLLELQDESQIGSALLRLKSYSTKQGQASLKSSTLKKRKSKPAPGLMSKKAMAATMAVGSFLAHGRDDPFDQSSLGHEEDDDRDSRSKRSATMSNMSKQKSRKSRKRNRTTNRFQSIYEPEFVKLDIKNEMTYKDDLTEEHFLELR